MDKEIEELYQYVNILDDKIRNENMRKFSFLAAIFLPATLVISFFGMNYGSGSCYVSRSITYLIVSIVAVLGSIIVWLLINKKK